MSYNLRDSDYWGQRGYERAFGDRDEYMDGYQQGYRAGYDNGLPFGIGDQTTITVPASGLLYLGTNDDNVSDNSGQFQVIISSGR